MKGAPRKGKPGRTCQRRTEHEAYLAQRAGRRPPPPRPHLFTSTRTVNGETTVLCSWCMTPKAK